jgi:hypothetical protein
MWPSVVVVHALLVGNAPGTATGAGATSTRAASFYAWNCASSGRCRSTGRARSSHVPRASVGPERASLRAYQRLRGRRGTGERDATIPPGTDQRLNRASVPITCPPGNPVSGRSRSSKSEHDAYKQCLQLTYLSAAIASPNCDSKHKEGCEKKYNRSNDNIPKEFPHHRWTLLVDEVRCATMAYKRTRLPPQRCRCVVA